MPVSQHDRKVVEDLFKAMQAGPGGEQAMMDLFAEDAVLVEPFTGTVQTHTGKPAIRASFKEMWRDPPPGMRLELDRLDLDGERVRAEWICHASVFSKPMRGHDLFTIQGGKIKRLEIVVTEMPPGSQ